MRYPTIAQHSWYTSPLHLLCSYPMIHILFNISIFMNYIDQRYWKLSLFSISWPSSLTTPLIMFLLLLNIHPMYFVLTLLNRKPLDSKVSHQISNLTFTSNFTHQNYTICIKYTPRDILLNQFSEHIHHLCKQIWTKCWSLKQTYSDKVFIALVYLFMDSVVV